MKNPTFIPSNLPALSFGELKNYLWFGGTGFLLLAMGLLGHLTAVRWAIVFLMASWLMVGVRGHLRARKAMTTQVKLFFLVVAALLAGFVFWARQLGLAWPVVIGALFLIDAFANMIASLTDWWRLSMLGHSLGLMVCGAGFPFVGKNRWPILAGIALLAGSLLAAAILYYQVRRHEDSPPPTSSR